MSHSLVSRSSDLTRLVNEGYDIEIRNGSLLVHHVPYVTEDGTVAFGILISEITSNGTETLRPGSHVTWLAGGLPYTHQGHVVPIVNDTTPHDFGDGLVAQCSMSGKPGGGHPDDYYMKMSNYVRILGEYARAIKPGATHTNYPLRESSPEVSVFRYHNAATSRSGISAVAMKLRLGKVVIIGLGGTGGYVLDLVAKTDVHEIHLYDDDVLEAHNAFRSPGAASQEELATSPLKVAHFFSLYDPMRRGIVPHPGRVTADNIEDLHDAAFVFITIDTGAEKRLIVERLVSWNIPFTDCGIGIERSQDSLRGIARVTTARSGSHGHLVHRIAYSEPRDDEYEWNIQTADLNMMNAALAVIKWKKLFGYYDDDKREMNCTYTVARNQIVNSESEQ